MSNKNDICKIIKACGEHGVKRIKIEDIEIEFNSPNPEPRIEELHPSFHLPQQNPPLFNPYTVEGPTAIATNDSESFDAEQREQELDEEYSTLMIEDPVTYEALMATGKIKDYGEAHAES